MQTLPALPSLTGWPSLVDPAVDGLNRINLSFQSQGPVIDMTAAAYRELTGDIRRFTTTTPQSSIDVNLSEPELDREQVHDAIKRLTNLRIRQRLEDTLELPPLPETAQRIIHLRVNPNAVMNDLVDVVESDPALQLRLSAGLRLRSMLLQGRSALCMMRCRVYSALKWS